jgi:PTS system nitrogen regulatory IIA component
VSKRRRPGSGAGSRCLTRIEGIREPVTVYARMRSPIDFAAPDRRGVSELLVLLVPADADSSRHLALLALVAKMFSDTKFRAGLRSAADPERVRSAFEGWVDREHPRGSMQAA